MLLCMLILLYYSYTVLVLEHSVKPNNHCLFHIRVGNLWVAKMTDDKTGTLALKCQFFKTTTENPISHLRWSIIQILV